MIVSREVVLTALARANNRLSLYTSNWDIREKDREFARNVVRGCMRILQQSSSVDLYSWIASRPYRLVLRDPDKAIATPTGRSAIFELILLTESVIIGDKTVRSHWDIGPLLEIGVESSSIKHARKPKQLSLFDTGVLSWPP
jgi:hypothetical protein